jgi:hypothetical protein
MITGYFFVISWRKDLILGYVKTRALFSYYLAEWIHLPG